MMVENESKSLGIIKIRLELFANKFLIPSFSKKSILLKSIIEFGLIFGRDSFLTISLFR